MTLSEDFMISICETDLQKKIIEVLKNPELSDKERIEILVKYIRESDCHD